MSAREAPRAMVTPVMGDTHEAWCTRCKAYTLVCASLHLLTPYGVTKSHTYAICETCEKEHRV